MSAVVERVPLAHRARTAPPALADRHETPLLAYAPSQVDETFIGTHVLLVGAHPTTGDALALAGGLSDIAQYCTGDDFETPCGRPARVLIPFTEAFVAGRHLYLTDALDVVLTTPPPAALAVS